MAKLIIDTSVWIDFFRGSLPKSLFENLAAALENDQVILTDIIIHEILVGAPDTKQYEKLADLLSPLPVLRIPNESLKDFDFFAWKLTQKGLRGRYTDASIAYLSQLHDYPLLTFDNYFKKLARAGVIRTIEMKDP